MNLAPVHALCILYRKTRKQRYLDMALQILDEFAAQVRATRLNSTPATATVQIEPMRTGPIRIGEL